MAYDERRVAQLLTDAETALAALRVALATPPQPRRPSTPSGTDAVDLSTATITRESPNVRGWPIKATLSSIGLSADGNMTIDFTKRNGPDAWPFVISPEGGEIQYTLWIGCLIGGHWHFAGSILCISRGVDDNYVPTGPTLAPGHLPKNWYYFAADPMATYQPKPGEQVAWFLTAGVQRRTDIHTIEERTNVVLTPFSEGTYP